MKADREVIRELEFLYDLVTNHLMPQKTNPDWKISMTYYDEFLEYGLNLLEDVEEIESPVATGRVYP